MFIFLHGTIFFWGGNDAVPLECLKLASFGRMVNFCTLPALCSDRSLALPIPAQTADLSSSSLGCERKSVTVSIRPRSDSLERPRTLDVAEEKKEAGSFSTTIVRC